MGQIPDVLAFSVLGWNYRRFGVIAETFKQINPNGIVVFGGNHVAHQGERVFREYPHVDVVVVGGYWTRGNDVEIDLVGADRRPVARRLLFLGSVKWLENSPFNGHDLAALHKHRSAVTDEPIPLVAVSRSGVSCSGSRRRTVRTS